MLASPFILFIFYYIKKIIYTNFKDFVCLQKHKKLRIYVVGVEGKEEDGQHHEKKSVLKKVKAKAKKIKDTITKHGHGHDHHHDYDDEEDDDEDDELIEDPEIQGAPCISSLLHSYRRKNFQSR